MDIKCPCCGNTDFSHCTEKDTYHGLVTVKNDNGSIKINASSVLPVKAIICKQCGFVYLTAINPLFPENFDSNQNQ